MEARGEDERGRLEGALGCGKGREIEEERIEMLVCWPDPLAPH